MAIGDAKPIPPSGEDLIARATKRVEWVAALRGPASAQPDLASLADYLAGTAKQPVGVERALSGG